MKKLTKHIIGIVIGILLCVWGGYAFSQGVNGPGELDVITGKLELIAPAYDPDFDVEVDSPFLKRNVEMFQYYRDARGYLDMDFFSTPQSVSYEKDKQNANNPPFPDDVKKAIFYGDVVIGEDRIHLAKDFLEKFSYGSYVQFKKDTPLYQVVGLDGGDEVMGLHPEFDEYYTNSYSELWHVGDIRVDWQVMNPVDFAPIYTAAGQLDGDTLRVKDGGSVFF